jgi:hypothetical protein
LAAAGGVSGVGPASGGMAAPHGSMTAFNAMRDGYLAHLALLDATTRAAALRERGPFKPAPVEPFKAGPDDIMMFADS